MTQPPQQPGSFGQDPYGQSPYNQPQGQQPGQFGQPEQPQQQPGGYPQGAEQPQWGTPAQGFNPQQQPYGQWDGTQNPQQGYPGYPGYPGGQPPKNKTGLIVGLVVLGVLVVGGIVALILVLTNKDDENNTAAGGPSASPSGKPSSSARPSRPSSRPSAGVPNPGGSSSIGTGRNAQPTPDALTGILATAYTQNSDASVVDAFCLGAPVTDSKFLPTSDLNATAKPAEAAGATAVLHVGITDLRPQGRNTGTMNFEAKQVNGSWCLTAITNFS